MEKTYLIDGHEIKLKAVASFAIVYRAQFGADVLKVLMPAVSKMAPAFVAHKDAAGDIASNPEAVAAIMEALSDIGLETLYNIIWTMARLADRNTPDPETWLAQFDTIPIDTALDALTGLLIPTLFSSVASKKN